MPTMAVPAVGTADDAPPRRRRRVGRVVAALVVIAALIVAGVIVIPKALAPSHFVPDLISHTEAFATKANGPLHFDLDITRVYRDDTVAGTILAQDPARGEKLKEGQTLHLTVSRGPTPTLVPQIDGKPEDIARQLLEGNFVLDEPERPFSEEIDKGLVMSHTPPGDELPKGSTIHLVVSNGPQPRKLSNWAGKSFDEAKKAIESVQLKVKRVDGYSDTIAVGLVISTSPGAGADVPRGATVTVTVAIGPLTIAVPNLGGKTVPEAKAILEGAGLKLGGVYGPNGNNRHVFAQSPGAGSKVDRGTAVNVFVN
jgi:serine/threonine-protein kinase